MEDNYSDELIHNLVKKQESYTKQEQPEIALILDDVLGTGVGSVRKNSEVNMLATRFRHYNIKLLLFSSQVFRYVSNVIRSNSTNVIRLTDFEY